MKLITWNVNGVRACLGKGMLDWVEAQAPDVLCLQEIKAKPEQIPEADRHRMEAFFPHIVWNPAERPGYSGTGTLALQTPDESRQGLGYPEFDVEGRAIESRYPGFWLFNLYFPNGQHDHGRVPYKLDFYARLLELCDELHAQGEKVILCGDFNTSHREIDLRNPKENENSTGFLPEERVWIDRYIEHGLVDIYRLRYPERVQYTWWTYRFNARLRNIGWRLDYFMISQALVEQVEDVIIHEEVPGSDHCPVSLILKK
ncbi:MAG: exodeoxyribonuclease III [Anaerolineales bacterium]|nr:exodeoxyribonuclease III [Anaerolineales bacterium]